MIDTDSYVHDSFPQVDDLREGDKLIGDEDCSVCIAQVMVVRRHPTRGLYVVCAHDNRHFLNDFRGERGECAGLWRLQ